MNTVRPGASPDVFHDAELISDGAKLAKRTAEEKQKKAVSLYRGIQFSMSRRAAQNALVTRRSAALKALLRSAQSRRRNRMGVAGFDEEEPDDESLHGGKKRSAVLRGNTQQIHDRHRDGQQQGGDENHGQHQGEQPTAMSFNPGRPPPQAAGELTMPLTDQLTALTGSAIEREDVIRDKAVAALLALRRPAAQSGTAGRRAAVQAFMLDFDLARAAHGRFGEADLVAIVRRLKRIHPAASTAGATPHEATAATAAYKLNLLIPLILLNAERPTRGTQRDQRRGRLRMIQTL